MSLHRRKSNTNSFQIVPWNFYFSHFNKIQLSKADMALKLIMYQQKLLLGGRVHSDTFFSTVNQYVSMYAFSCLCTRLDHLFSRCTQIDSLTRNLSGLYERSWWSRNDYHQQPKTQPDKNFIATSCSIITNQCMFDPHSQNQHKTERWIKDIKHKSIFSIKLVEYLTLIFVLLYELCYWLPNHVANKTLN